MEYTTGSEYRMIVDASFTDIPIKITSLKILMPLYSRNSEQMFQWAQFDSMNHFHARRLEKGSRLNGSKTMRVLVSIFRKYQMTKFVTLEIEISPSPERVCRIEQYPKMFKKNHDNEHPFLNSGKHHPIPFRNNITLSVLLYYGSRSMIYKKVTPSTSTDICLRMCISPHIGQTIAYGMPQGHIAKIRAGIPLRTRCGE
ncbi:hypothetical protein V1478_006453 [Vespula squamosa]|uniref:Uncharacterized protein n=1 Tax=Vespula squamosa TaxID=30214 RepID=A0ABD2B7X8_VESSQ